MKDMSAELMHDVVIRYDRHALDEAEIRCQEKIAAEKFGATVNHSTNNPSYKTDLVQQIEQARQKIQDAITSTEASPPPQVCPEPESPVSSEPVTPITPTAPGAPEAPTAPGAPEASDEAMTKSKRKRERKKRARAAAGAGTPTTPIATKTIVAKVTTPVTAKPDASESKTSQNATTTLSTSNKPDAHVATTRPSPVATKLASRPTEFQPISSFIANNNNNNQPIGVCVKNHVIDYDDPETIKTYINRVDSLEQENKSLKSTVSSLQSSLKALEDRVKSLELGSGAKTTGKAAASTKKADSDSDVDLFGSDDEDEKPAPKPVAKPAAKKPVKAGPIAKSLIQLYVKPWDDETDMKVMEKLVRSVEMDGLMWGTSQLVPVGYGIKKLQIACVVEDDKVGTDDLEEKISAFEDLVQSVDIASFNKL